MKAGRRLARLGGAVAAATLGFGSGVAVQAWAADLPVYRSLPAPAPYPQVYRYVPVDPDPGPASYSGYFGYYGYDLGGVPYNGLYSETTVCLRSIRTPRGYRTVDVCRPN